MSSLKHLIRPLRLAMGRFVIPPERLLRTNPVHTMTLAEKVADFVSAEKVAGDYLEFGVFEGWAFSRSYLALEAAYDRRTTSGVHNSSPEDARERAEAWNAMRFFAFDSFEGLPALEGVDRESSDFRKGQYAAGMDVFKGKIQGYGVPLDRAVCVPGWFNQTCTTETRERHKISKAAVVYVDCDLYSSTKSVLDFITPVLQDGTVVVFDDWFSFRGNPSRGEQRAFAEWTPTVQGFTFAEYHREGYSRVSFIASRVLED